MSVLGFRGLTQHLVTIERWSNRVESHHIAKRDRVRHWLYMVEIQSLDIGRVLEHITELFSEHLKLVLAELESGEVSYMSHFFRRYPLRHED